MAQINFSAERQMTMNKAELKKAQQIIADAIGKTDDPKLQQKWADAAQQLSETSRKIDQVMAEARKQGIQLTGNAQTLTLANIGAQLRAQGKELNPDKLGVKDANLSNSFADKLEAFHNDPNSSAKIAKGLMTFGVAELALTGLGLGGVMGVASSALPLITSGITALFACSPLGATVLAAGIALKALPFFKRLKDKFAQTAEKTLLSKLENANQKEDDGMIRNISGYEFQNENSSDQQKSNGQNQSEQSESSQNQSEQSEATQNQTTESEASQNQTTESEATQNQSEQGEATQNQSEQGEATQNQTTQNQSEQSEASQNQTTESEASQNQTTESEASQNQATQTDATKNKATQSQARQSRTAQPNDKTKVPYNPGFAAGIDQTMKDLREAHKNNDQEQIVRLMSSLGNLYGQMRTQGVDMNQHREAMNKLRTAEQQKNPQQQQKTPLETAIDRTFSDIERAFEDNNQIVIDTCSKNLTVLYAQQSKSQNQNASSTANKTPKKQAEQNQTSQNQAEQNQATQTDATKNQASQNQTTQNQTTQNQAGKKTPIPTPVAMASEEFMDKLVNWLQEGGREMGGSRKHVVNNQLYSQQRKNNIVTPVFNDKKERVGYNVNGKLLAEHLNVNEQEIGENNLTTASLIIEAHMRGNAQAHDKSSQAQQKLAAQNVAEAREIIAGMGK